MKNIRHLAPVFAAVCAALLLAAPDARAQATPNPPGKLTYQGFLTDANGTPLGGGAPINTNVIFRIHTAATGGTLRWSEQQVVTIDNGHFSVLLGEGAQVASEPNTNNLTGIFTGTDASDRYMEITVNATVISPRLQFLPAPYALLAASARQVLDPNGANLLTASVGNIGINNASPATTLDVGGTITGTGLNIVGTATATAFTGSGAGLTALNASQLASGTVADARLSANVALLNATSQTFAGTNTFNGGVIFSGFIRSSGGDARGGNAVDLQTFRFANDRVASGDWSVLSGGYNNKASGINSTVAGGAGATASGRLSTVVGGENNNASGEHAIVLSGLDNLASGSKSVVFGGSANTASGAHAYAAGYRAKAVHNGTFVWKGDFGDTDFSSTGNDQFLIKAPGGVGIGTQSPTAQLHVKARDNTPTGAIRVEAPNSANQFSIYYDERDGLPDVLGFKFNNNNAGLIDEGGAFYNPSDRRLKKDVVPLAHLLEKASALRPVSYRLKNSAADSGRHIGFIAQEVEEIFPELVLEGDTKALNYSGFGPVAIGAVQELHQLVKDKDGELQDLKKRVADLEALVKTLAGAQTGGSK